MMGFGMSGFWMGLGFIITLLIAIWVVRELFPQQPSTAEDALDIAQKRYAKGELSREEFETIKQDLVT